MAQSTYISIHRNADFVSCENTQNKLLMKYCAQLFRVMRRKHWLALMILFFVLNIEPSYAQVFMIVSPKENAVSDLHSQAVTVQGPANMDAELWMNGTLIGKNKIRVDGIADFLNIEVPSGTVQYEVRLFNNDGSPFAAQQRTLHILGTPSVISIDVENERLQANEQSSIKGTIRVFDEWNYPLTNGIVTIGVDSGNIVSEDIDPSTRGIQLQLQQGSAVFEYRSGKNAGVATILVQSDVVQASKEIILDTPVEPLTIVGLVNGTGNAASGKNTADGIADANSFPDKFQTDGRAAVYARGTVMHDYFLTLSYDSDRRNRSRLFRDLDPDFLYSIYGDNSMLSYDAQTNNNLFAKLERNQSYILYGDYNTDMTKQEFTLYNRSLNGVKLGHQDKQWKLTAFASQTDRKQVQTTLRGNGLSGFYDVGYTYVTPGSEKIRIETRDKFHSEVILKQQDQYRFSDYDFDYQQGTLFFKQPVPSIDNEGNPVYIVVTFEARTTADKTFLGGGRAEHNVTENFTLGVTGISEEQSPSNYTLLGGDVKYHVGNDFSLNGEVGRSSNITGSGLAYKFETTVSPVSALSLKGYYRKVEQGFFNITQSGGRQELGTVKYGTSGTYSPFVSTKLSAQYYKTKQNILNGNTTLNSVEAGIEQKLAENLNGTLRVEDITYDAASQDTLQNSIATHSTLAAARLNYSLNEKIIIGAEREQNLGTNQDKTKPNATSVLAEYKIAENISLVGQEKFYEQNGNLSSIGINTTPIEGTNVYGKYEIGNAIGEKRNMVSIGIKNTLKVTDDITANFGYEKAKSLEQRIGQASTQDHAAYSAGFEYLPNDVPLKLSTKSEYGENNLSKKFNFTFGGDYRLRRDLSTILKIVYANDNAIASTDYRTQTHIIWGLAYRPVEENWFNSIAKVEMKRDANFYLHPFINYGALIFSDHSFFEVSKRLEIGTKYAFKIADERSDQFFVKMFTQFFLIRTEYDITDKFDIAGEYRILIQSETNDLLNGYSAEFGYVVAKNLRLAAGYNFKGYKERDLVDYTLWSKGPFINFKFKFDEDLFGL